MDGWLNGWMVEWMDGWLVGWLILRNDASLQLVRPAVPYTTRRGTLGRQQMRVCLGTYRPRMMMCLLHVQSFSRSSSLAPPASHPFAVTPHAPHPAAPGQHGRGLLRHGRRRSFERVLQVPARRRGHHRPAARTSLRLSTPSLRREIGESARNQRIFLNVSLDSNFSL